jgi:hypothetical protein
MPPRPEFPSLPRRLALALSIAFFTVCNAFPQHATVETIPGLEGGRNLNYANTRAPSGGAEGAIVRTLCEKGPLSANNIQFTLARHEGTVPFDGSGSGTITYWSADRYRRGKIEYTLQISLDLQAHSQQPTSVGADYTLRDDSGMVVIGWKSCDTTGNSIEILDLRREFLYIGPPLPTGTLTYRSTDACVASMVVPLPVSATSNYPKPYGIEFSRAASEFYAHIIAPSGYDFVKKLTLPGTAYGSYTCDFRPDYHGWGFGNSDRWVLAGSPDEDWIMWHKVWWSGFDYQKSPDAPLGYECPAIQEFTCYVRRQDFPDWPLFEEAF